ncbi:glycoside hydrolase family protein [Mycobacterium sp. PO1]|nr:glycoside hydrolase family protein [Mycobacterium sp. PO1]GFM24008.1 glycoside hydrolase family protein [Mycobacterium sp. PO2]
MVVAGLGAAMLTASVATASATPADSGASAGSSSQDGTSPRDANSSDGSTTASAPDDDATDRASDDATDHSVGDELDDSDVVGEHDEVTEEISQDSDDEAVDPNRDTVDLVESVDISGENDFSDENDIAGEESAGAGNDTDEGTASGADDAGAGDAGGEEQVGTTQGDDSGSDESGGVSMPVPVTRKETDHDEVLRDAVDRAPAPVDRAPAAAQAHRVAADPPAETASAQSAMSVTAASPARITVGSMIVDMLYSLGIRNTGLGADFLAIPVPRFIESWWQGVRTRIYRDVVIPEPEPEPEPEPGPEPEPAPEPADPELLWESNFTDMSEALRYWGLQTGRWGAPAGENQYYTDGDNVYIDADGNLVIDARREATPDGLGAPHNYTSARVVTYGKQSFGVGTRVVARIQMPATQGSLPAFWSVGLEPGHEFDWPRQGEIDIVEIPGLGTPQSRRVWTGNIHGPDDTDNGVDVTLHDVAADLGIDLSQGFHDYGMDWYADRIVWHVDGVEVGSVTQAQYEALGGDWTPFSGAWDHYLILNVAVGNPWTGDPDPSAPFHAQMKVDWVKAYQL